MSNGNASPYTSGKINNLAPTDGIKDPQVRAFCDSLANVWQLRNGNIGFDDKERFITKQEWDYIAKNPNIRALAAVGQPGASTPGGPGEGYLHPPLIQNMIDIMMSGITLYDFTKIIKTNNEIWASIYALTTDVRNQITIVNGDISGLEEDITQINTITDTSTSESARTLFGVKKEMGDATAAIIEINNVTVTSTSANAKQTAALVARVGDSEAAIIEINEVSATSDSANARQLWGMSATVDGINDPNNPTGLVKAHADIAQLNFVDVNSTSANAKKVAGMLVEFGNPNSTAFAAINHINYVSADSASASARQLHGTMAAVGLKSKVFAQTIAPVSDANYTLKPGDIWINISNKNAMMTWNGSAWVDASDKRIAESMAGVLAESNARASDDSALATAVNAVWGIVGNHNALIIDSATITINPNVGEAVYFKQVYNQLSDPNGNLYKAASELKMESHVSAVTQTANASSSLMTQATVNGVTAIAGFKLTAEVTNGSKPTSAAVFLVDSFYIIDKAMPYPAFAPFAVTADGHTRMRVARIEDFIQSDLFAQPGQTINTAIPPATNYVNYPDGTGWKIQKNGNAEFYGATTMARVVSGSRLVDRNSGQTLSTTAVSAWSFTGSVAAGSKAAIQTHANLMFLGPDNHGTGTPNLYRRIRSSNVGGINLVTKVEFVGVADHFVSIWYSYRGGAWQWLNGTHTPTPDYNAATCAWVGTLPCDLNGFYQFGVSATDSGGGVESSSKVELRDFTLSVTMSNM